ALIQRRQRASFRPNEGVASKTVSQHSVEIYQSALDVVAAKGVEGITHPIKGIGARNAGPEGVSDGTGAGQAHAQTAMIFQIVWEPVFAFAAQEAGANDIVGHQVPVASDPRMGDRIVNLLVAEESNGDKWRI